MAIADMATATSDGTGTSLTYAHTVGGTTDLAIWVAVDDFRSPTSADPSGITYAAGALTRLSGYDAGGGNDNKVSVWRRAAPSTGANNVIVTHAQSHDITAMSISYSGVDQTTPNDAVQLSDTTTATPSIVVTSATGDQTVSFAFCWAPTGGGFTYTGTGTERNENNNTNTINSVAVADAPGAATVTMSWNAPATDPQGSLAFNVNASAGGGGGATSFIPLSPTKTRLPFLVR